ncbi:FtsX-like permease family protein [Niallia circulans]|uniref:ABC transporter permease n=1 Tax=Niallia circulans TaxID=1397 RepID=UPI002041408D|nr:FtsX-like permease family protein [Niallia circulans]MCM2982337.1 FtsX-like permease family protein [Niallia circulans]
MLLKIVQKDLWKNKGISIVLFIFIWLSALLISSAAGMITQLVQSAEHLFMKAAAPHFVQMHAGELDAAAIERWAKEQPLVDNQQTAEMLTIDGNKLFLGKTGKPETNGVMDISFVKQNKAFDFLVDMNNEVIRISPGEIGIPIYYQQRNLLNYGDQVTLSAGKHERKFTVTHFVRDAMMNPSIVHSKRFLISDADYDELKQYIHSVEYLIEFQLKDIKKINEFSQSYQSANLPNQGPAVDYNTFKILNALTDGIIALVILLVSLILIIIAILCLRLTISSTLEEEYREIGVMKAIGFPSAYIKRIYLIKYFVISAAASLIGYLSSLIISPFISRNMQSYLGIAPKSLLNYLIPLIAAIGIFMIVIFACSRALGRFRSISAVEALRSAGGEIRQSKKLLAIKKSRILNINILLGIKDTITRLKMYGLLFFVFISCAFIMIVPVNFLKTIQSPSFVSYMGIGQSDIRIDFQHSPDIAERFSKSLTYIEKDPDVKQFVSMVTTQYKVIGDDGTFENISVEIGDMSIFPLEYLNGHAPIKENEIALSYLNAQELNKSVGDSLFLMVEGQKKELKVTGIYQDVTNGGRTAKAMLPIRNQGILWYVVQLDIGPNVSIKEKIEEYSTMFHPVKVTHLKGYLGETLGDTIKQVQILTIISVFIALSISMLITALFIKMLIAKDSAQIAIMKSIGFSLKDLLIQYMTKIISVLAIAIAAGTILSNILGEKLVSILWSFIGAADIEFIIDPVQAYLVCPILLFIVVAVTIIIAANYTLPKPKIIELNGE